MQRLLLCSGLILGIFASASVPVLTSEGPAGSEKPPPILLKEDFAKGSDRWQPTDPKAWKLDKLDGLTVFNQFKKRSNYKPPHRSPLNIALLKDITVGSFQLDAKVKSTIKDYGHRDVCLFFGYQDPAHFYYVHFGKKMDDHANQIFIVNGRDRTKISTTTTKGTPWNDDWHNLRVRRDVDHGWIKVYYDDMQKPIMTATDKTFLSGRVGIGSFDDTTVWSRIVLRGKRLNK